MKPILKNILKYYLKFLTKTVLFIHKPIIIVVAGSTNKHFIKQEIKNILSSQNFTVRANPKNFNTEIGLPLAVLDLPSGYNSYLRWLPVIKLAFLTLFQKNFPKYLVLDLGSSDPGDMKYLLKLVKPRVAIISDITQRYLEGFNGLDELLSEYEHLAKKLKKNDYLLINNDNSRVKSLENKTEAKVISFGFSDGSDCQATNIAKINRGQEVVISLDGNVNKYSINRFGQHHVYSKMIGLIFANIFNDLN